MKDNPEVFRSIDEKVRKELGHERDSVPERSRY
jgi:hypothetical protein